MRASGREKIPVFLFGKRIEASFIKFAIPERSPGVVGGWLSDDTLSNDLYFKFTPEQKNALPWIDFFCPDLFKSRAIFCGGNVPDIFTKRKTGPPPGDFLDWDMAFASAFLNAVVKFFQSSPMVKNSFIDPGGPEYAYSICNKLVWDRLTEIRKTQRDMEIIVEASVKKFYERYFSGTKLEELPIGDNVPVSSKTVAAHILSTGIFSLGPFSEPGQDFAAERT